MLNKITKSTLGLIPLLFVVSTAHAQTISVVGVNAEMAIGDITSFARLVQFLINFTI